MDITCPACRLAIASEHLDVRTDMGVCPNCDVAFSISAILDGKGRATDVFKPDAPPRGAWFEETSTGWRFGATTQSPIAFFLVPFACAWSWSTVGQSFAFHIANDDFTLTTAVGELPFLVGSVLLCAVALMSVCGKVVVLCDHDEGCVFVGVGPFEWPRFFNWASVTAVKEEALSFGYPGNSGMAIAIIGQTRLKFGGMLTDSRRYYLLQCLRKSLAERQRSHG